MINIKKAYIAGVVALLATIPAMSYALSANQFTTTSRLTSGKWVKIAVRQNGIYQITYKELNDMGFSNPQSVRIYGVGGHPMSETLDGKAIDDLKAVPFKHYDNKICFYANGPVKYTLTTPTGTPHYTREYNSYSTKGYYFITCDDGTTQKQPTKSGGTSTSGRVRMSSLDYCHHEQELVSPSMSGKNFLGELLTDGNISIPYSMPNICNDSVIVVNTCAAAKASKQSVLSAKLNNEDIPFPSNTKNISPSYSQYVFYNSATPFAELRAQSPIPENGTVSVNITCNSADIVWGRMDYYILTFYHTNSVIEMPDNQTRIGLNQVVSNDLIVLDKEGTTGNLHVWNVTKPDEPKEMNIFSYDDKTSFCAGTTIAWAQYVAFDSSKELMTIDGYEEVGNQNIHGLETPDMVIVTCDKLMPEAERIAQMHRDNDNMTVHVIDQQKIFNEFSSGTPDAMAIRLMNKMFYDRDNSKFRYVLMFGQGSYDNRQIISQHECPILTYESNVSNDESYSYVNDDFFGFLDDNSGKTPAADVLRLGIGRIPCVSLHEAKGDVDKLLKYVNSKDYGAWRNEATFVADHINSDGNLHAYQAEGISNIMNDELATGLFSNKVYMTQFPVDGITGQAVEAQKELTSLFKKGQYFMTYVGHADPNTLTKSYHLWTANESRNIENAHYPILTTACCDVARYDSNQRGVMEILFHNNNGGAIAMVASTRSAYASDNDALNQAFVRNMFSYNATGHMPTIGEAYMLCKQSFGKSINYNKLMFVLLGDPALKINYPKPKFIIKKINGRDANANISTRAMQEVTIEAIVCSTDSSTVDTSFNGTATLSIYDLLQKETEENGRPIYFTQRLLTQVEGRVNNGVFTSTALIPRYIISTGSPGLVKVYAHRDNSDEMVNGSFNKLLLYPYAEGAAQNITDTIAPTILSFYLDNEQDFAQRDAVGNKCTIHVAATDDHAFNNQKLNIGNGMTLKLDEGKSTFPNVNNYSIVSNGGKRLDVSYPVNIPDGEHSLQFSVYDAAGNCTTQSITFMINSSPQITLSVEEEQAINEATFNITTSLAEAPEVNLKVFDSMGKMVWSTTTSSFPVVWNLTDKKGKKVPAGVYRYHGSYQSGQNYGGTEIGNFIVMPPNNTSF